MSTPSDGPWQPPRGSEQLPWGSGQLPRRREWSRLSLQGRLTLLVAAAVALAVALVSAFAFLAVRAQLLDQVDEDLAERARRSDRIDRGFVARLDSFSRAGEAVSPELLQLIDGGGARLAAGAEVGQIPVRDVDREVAQGVLPSTLRDDDLEGGSRVRILTVPISGPRFVGAVQLVEPLDDVEATLRRLGLLAAAAGLLGVLGATAVGWAVARAGLAPVERLTRTVERAARTQDLGTVIEVRGDDEVARLAGSFNGLMSALAAARDQQRQLIDDASHELRTPLTSLRTNIELLLRAEEHPSRSLPAEDRTALLRDVRLQTAELTELVTELVSLARAETAPEGEQHLDWAAVVAQSTRRMGAHHPGVTYRLNLHPASVVGRRAALARAVSNLLDNAAKFSPPGSVVDVGLQARPDGCGELVVADRGLGIEPADRTRVFERFYRSPAARALPGSGLGLAIVAQTVASFGGRVQAEPREGGGTILRMSLPLAAGPGLAEASAVQALPAAVGARALPAAAGVPTSSGRHGELLEG